MLKAINRIVLFGHSQLGGSEFEAHATLLE